MRKIFSFVLSIFLFVLLWEVLSIFVGNQYFPGPFIVFRALIDFISKGIIFPHILSSLKRVITGFFASLILAFIIGYITGTFQFLKSLLSPIVEILRPIPPIAWIPLAIVWFGIGDFSASFIIFIAAFFPIYTNVHFGVSSIPRIYKRISKNYRLDYYKQFFHIIFPFTLPYLFTGTRVGIGLSWMAVIGSEMIASSRGLGYFIEVNRMLLRIDYMIATMIIIGIIGFCFYMIFKILDLKLNYWKDKE